MEKAPIPGSHPWHSMVPFAQQEQPSVHKHNNVGDSIEQKKSLQAQQAKLSRREGKSDKSAHATAIKYHATGNSSMS